MGTAIIDTALRIFEFTDLCTLTEDFSKLISMWADIRYRYINVHGWYAANQNFFLYPQTYEMKTNADKLVYLKASIDKCMELIDAHGYCLSKNVSQLGLCFVNKSYRQFLKKNMDDIKITQVVMRELCFRFDQMEDHLKNPNALLVPEVMASFQPSHAVRTKVLPSHGGMMNVQPSRGGMMNVQPSRGVMINMPPSDGGMMNVQPSYGGMTNVQPSYGGMTNVQPSYGGMTNVQPSCGGMMNVQPSCGGMMNVQPSCGGMMNVQPSHEIGTNVQPGYKVN